MAERFNIRPNLIIDWAKCTGCGSCTLVCPVGAIQISDNHEFAIINYNHALCLYCRRCAFACPENAIEYGGFTEPAGSFSLVVRTEEKIKVELQACRNCGSTFMPKPLVTKVGALLRDYGIEITSLTTLCPSCRSRELFSRYYPLKGAK